MKKYCKTRVLGSLAVMGLIGIFSFQLYLDLPKAALAENNTFSEIPVKGMVTMIDLGAKKCIPCKMMAPIMERVQKRYKDKAAIIFIDVWENQAPAKQFGIRAIPTQIFFNKEGKEIYRHIGFLSEEAIVAQLKKMGVD